MTARPRRVIGRLVWLGGTVTTVNQMLGSVPCGIPVTDDGQTFSADGQTLPVEARPRRCGHPADIMVGAAPTCAHHLADLPRVDPNTTLTQLLGPLVPLACPERATPIGPDGGSMSCGRSRRSSARRWLVWPWRSIGVLGDDVQRLRRPAAAAR